jgi:GH35 family endo-1,4-beta-xylanase
MEIAADPEWLLRDPATQDYFIPRGLAYQTFNPPVGANQSLEQLAYDLVEFKKMYANSVRAEMVWNQVETSPGHFEWTQADFLVQKADELGLKLFVLIGFQYAPSWFPEEWKAVNSQGSNSVVLAYEHPEARRAYTNFIAHVTARYKNSAAIGAWILGNEYAYFDLWEPSRSFLGFDSYSLVSFRTFLVELTAATSRR